MQHTFLLQHTFASSHVWPLSLPKVLATSPGGGECLVTVFFFLDGLYYTSDEGQTIVSRINKDSYKSIATLITSQLKDPQVSCIHVHCNTHNKSIERPLSVLHTSQLQHSLCAVSPAHKSPATLISVLHTSPLQHP